MLYITRLKRGHRPLHVPGNAEVTIYLVQRKVRIGTIPELYLREVGIPTLRTDHSGIELHYERILTLSAKVGILTLRRTIPELSRSSLCAEHIHVHTSTDIFKNRNIIKYNDRPSCEKS